MVSKIAQLAQPLKQIQYSISKKCICEKGTGYLPFTYYYSFERLTGDYVKTDKDSSYFLAKVSNTDGAYNVYDASSVDSKNNAVIINPSTTTAVVEKGVIKADDGLYYISGSTTVKAGEAVEDGYFVLAGASTSVAGVLIDVTTKTTLITDGVLADTTAYKLTRFEKALTGSGATGNVKTTSYYADGYADYSIDIDGYIPLSSGTSVSKLASSKLINGYYVTLSKAWETTTDALNKESVAQALADGVLTTKAAAVNVQVYKV